MEFLSRNTYHGTRHLVLAIDFGATFSSISYAILEPGHIPEIKSVSDPDIQGSNSTRFPSEILYDLQGNVRASGFQVRSAGEAETSVTVVGLKCLFSADHEGAGGLKVILPDTKNPAQVLGDYLQHLMALAGRYFIHHEANNGPDAPELIWKQLRREVTYVFSHPNDWNDTLRSQLLEASVCGKLVLDMKSARARIRFVSEGTAAFYWCLEKDNTLDALSIGHDVIVADVGGGTIDVSSFRMTSLQPPQFEETKRGQSLRGGSLFITQAFEDTITAQISHQYPDEISHLVQQFYHNTIQRPQRTPMGSLSLQLRDRSADSPILSIHNGRLNVPRSFMEELFSPCCNIMYDEIRARIDQPSSSTTIRLVGGLSAHPWFYDEVVSLSQLGVSVGRPNETPDSGPVLDTSSVADGAVRYYLERQVFSRVLKNTYGVFGAPLYDPADLQHSPRMSAVYKQGGKKYVAGKFYTLAKKGTTVLGEKEFPETFEYRQSSLKPRNYLARFELICYRGVKSDIVWKDDDSDSSFRTVCTSTAEIPASAFKWEFRINGWCWVVQYRRVATFGTHGVTCRLEWGENGKSTPVSHSLLHLEPH